MGVGDGVVSGSVVLVVGVSVAEVSLVDASSSVVPTVEVELED